MRRRWMLVALLALLTLVGCRRAAPPIPAPGDPYAWTLLVRAAGPRRLGPDWWRAHGVDLDGLRAEDVRLRRAGQPVPFVWAETDEGPALLFHGTVAPGRFGPVGAYHLDLEGGEGALAPDPAPEALPDAVQETTLASAWLERDLKYRTTAPASANWLWASLNAPDALTLTVPLTEALAAPVTLTLRLWGQSSMPANPDHHVRVLWNGELVADHAWDGNALETLVARAPSARAGENTLALIFPGDTGAPVEVTWLDAVGVTWDRAMRHAGPGWSTWVAGPEPVACWEGLDGAALVWLVDEAASVRAADVRAEAGRACVAQRPGERGWIGLPEDAPLPDLVRPRETVAEPVLLAAEYLIVAPRAFHGALLPLAEAREAEGLAVAIVTPEQFYDAYGTGAPEAAAIRAAVLDLHARGKLRFLLLAGDASADPRAVWQPGAALVPTGWARTSFVGDTPSDHALVADDDGAPLVAVGRFPAATVDEVEAMVAKTLEWEPTARLLLLSDDEAEFAGMADALAAVQPVDRRLDAGAEDVRRDLLDWLRAEPGVLVYSGHGSLPMLGDEKLLVFEDAGAWDGPTVVVAWTCLCASFTHPSTSGLSEAWLKSPRGSVAFVGPTGETTTSEQAAMALAFQRGMAEGETLGAALLAGWQAAGSRDAEVSFVLLGDPALRPMPASGSTPAPGE